MNLVISLRPLAPSAVPQFGTPTREISAEQLLQRGVAATLKELRATRYERVAVVGTGEELASYLPILSAVAALVRTAHIESIDLGSGVRRELPRREIFRDGFRLIGASLAGLWSVYAKRKEVRMLSDKAHRPVVLDPANDRVLYLKSGPFSNVAVGGSVGHVAGVANAFARRGLTVRLLAVARQREVQDSIEQCLVAAPRAAALPVVANAARFSAEFRGAAERLIDSWPPAFCYQRYSPFDLTGAHLQRRGVPWVVEYNGSEVWAQRHWGRPMAFEQIARSIEHAVLRLADLVVTVSEPLRAEVLALGVPPERVLCYPNCIDAERFDPARFSREDVQRTRREFDLDPRDLVFAFIGTFGLWHGLGVLAEAIRLLIDSNAQLLREHRIRFLLVGNGSQSALVANRLGAPGDEEFVRLPGARPQNEAPGILAASDVLLSPHTPNTDGSSFFGSPTKLFEYLAMAKPIIASDLDQIGDVARGWIPTEEQPPHDTPSECALLVEPGNPAALAEAMLAAARLPSAVRETMGSAGRTLALKAYTWDSNVSAVLARLKEEVASSPTDAAPLPQVDHTVAMPQ